MMNVPVNVSESMNILNSSGFRVYAVGGSVRDALMGVEPVDWDLATNARLGTLEDLFPGAKIISEKYSVIRRDFPIGGQDPEGLQSGSDIWGNASPLPHVDIATFRTEGAYSDSRRPDLVTFVETIEEDLYRRDFTINAIAYGIAGDLVDPFLGQQDLANRVIRCIGEPQVRFKENPIRMLRAIRMAAEYDFNLESHAFQAMRHMGRNLSKAGPDRARTEFLRLICAPHASRGLKLMVDTHLLEVICGISSEMMSQDNLVAISNLIQTIDETPKNATTRLPLFYRCFGKNLGQTAIETLHYDKKTRKQLESTLTEGICLQKRNAR